ncbi:YitT family protein [Virgibacillus halodenitrificans]|uniref:YitT family protein n=1 Tax=Virgibacillus halodenitrificans TaxID=1482 RepID=UPI0024BFA670|nr:YitT family protein [Virgibacillus halodenitrificans]WHX26599.1 YitT family protein [Virgibacillus halodenitrificans]
MQKVIKDMFLIVSGSLIFALGINYFAIPNNLSEGGIIGISIVTYYLFEWSPGLVNFVINAILLLVGYRFFDHRVMIYTIVAIIFSSGFLHFTSGVGSEINEDTLLAALFAGGTVGLGLGMIFRTGGTSGGTAIIVRILSRYLGWSMGKGMLVIDILVIAGSAFVIGQEKAMYTLIAVYIGAKVIDVVVEGANERTSVLIISKHPDRVLEAVTQNMARGITILEGRGGYTNRNKEVLYLVINKQEIVKFRKIIEEIDEDAYVTVHTVQEILRKGYKGAK